jgi:hypothetical protein
MSKSGTSKFLHQYKPKNRCLGRPTKIVGVGGSHLTETQCCPVRTMKTEACSKVIMNQELISLCSSVIGSERLKKTHYYNCKVNFRRYVMGTGGSCPGSKGQECMELYLFMEWYLVKHRDNFTFICIYEYFA